MQEDEMPAKKKSSKQSKKEETHGYSPASPTRPDKAKGKNLMENRKINRKISLMYTILHSCNAPSQLKFHLIC